jgi:exosortase A-associated hydrolase 1
MAESAITFRCSGEELIGILHAPDHEVRDTGVLIVVGGPQYRVGSHRQFTLTARAFARAGYPVFRFDYRGMGDSSGEMRTFETVDDDIRCAVDAFVAAAPEMRRIVIFGLCDAASAALIYAPTDPRLGGLILANPWARTDAGQASAYVRHYYGRRLLQKAFWRKLMRGELDVLASLRDFVGKWRLAGQRPGGDAGAAAVHFIERMRLGAQRFSGPTLLLLSGRDLTAREFAALGEADAEWRRILGSPTVSRRDIADADHTFSGQPGFRAAVAECLEWLESRGQGGRQSQQKPPGTLECEARLNR